MRWRWRGRPCVDGGQYSTTSWPLRTGEVFGANLSWEYAGILEQPDQTVESDVLQHQTEDQLHQQHQELIIAVTCLSISLASLSLIASCLCWRSCRRRSNTPISFQNNRTLALGESSHLISWK